MLSVWRSLRVPPYEFSLRNTFSNGQCWCWKEINATTWCGVIGHTVYLLRQLENDVQYKVMQSPTSPPSPTSPTPPPPSITSSTSSTSSSTSTSSNQQTIQKKINLQKISSFSSSVTTTTTFEQKKEEEENILRDFLQLETNMAPLKERWMSGDAQIHQDMAIILTALPGMRVLRQDPLECLFSFMSSANNNITRIGK